MLYIKLNSALMVSEPIGRFFPDPSAKSCDSKIQKTRSYSRDILISNTANEKGKVFRDSVARTYVWSIFKVWRIS